LTDPLERELAAIEASRRRILDASDSDRRVFERTLHDELQQDLVALLANLELLSAHIASDPEASQLLDDLKQAATDAHEHAAALAQTLYPPLLEARGLASAIRAAAAGAGVSARVEVVERAHYSGDSLNAVYWVCFEALSAAPRGSDVDVRVGEAPQALTFEVEISGKGDESRLQRLRDRVETLGGEVAAQRLPNGRCRLYGILPLSA
jgi:signal transduction histidine kinase